MLFAAIVAALGFFFFAREIVASGVELAEQRRHEREERERRERGNRL